MLIDKSGVPAENDVIVFRLVSGEEILAKVVKSDIMSLHVTKPVVLAMQMMGNDIGIAFAPFMAGVPEDNVFEIPFAAMTVKPMKARDEMRARYLKMTTGLEVPSSPLGARRLS